LTESEILVRNDKLGEGHWELRRLNWQEMMVNKTLWYLVT